LFVICTKFDDQVSNILNTIELNAHKQIDRQTDGPCRYTVSPLCGHE